MLNAETAFGYNPTASFLSYKQKSLKTCSECNRRTVKSCASAPKRRSRKPKGYWDDISNVKTELLSFISSNQDSSEPHMPNARELRAGGRRDLDNAITKLGGYHNASALLGIPRSSRMKPPGYWRDFSNLQRELLSFCESCDIPSDIMPTQSQFRECKRSDLVEAIEQHGGIAEVAAKLNRKQRVQRKSKHYWKDWSKVESEIRIFVEEKKQSITDASSGPDYSLNPYQRQFDSMPSQSELRAAGRTDLVEAISDYHGGFRLTAKKLGFESRKKDDFYYDKFYNLAREIYGFVDELGQEGVMPLTRVMKSNGRTDLAAAIAKYNGMSQVSQRLGLQYRVRTREAFKDWNLFSRSLKAFMKIHGTPGEIPSSRTLTNYSRQDLYQAILHHGGSREVADKMGLKRNYWQNFPFVGERLLQFIDTHGTEGVMPTEQEFLEIGQSSLNIAVSKFGHSQVAKRLGLRESSQPAQTALDTLLTQSLALYDLE